MWSDHEALVARIIPFLSHLTTTAYYTDALLSCSIQPVFVHHSQIMHFIFSRFCSECVLEVKSGAGEQSVVNRHTFYSGQNDSTK